MQGRGGGGGAVAGPACLPTPPGASPAALPCLLSLLFLSRGRGGAGGGRQTRKVPCWAGLRAGGGRLGSGAEEAPFLPSLPPLHVRAWGWPSVGQTGGEGRASAGAAVPAVGAGRAGSGSGSGWHPPPAAAGRVTLLCPGAAGGGVEARSPPRLGAWAGVGRGRGAGAAQRGETRRGSAPNPSPPPLFPPAGQEEEEEERVAGGAPQARQRHGEAGVQLQPGGSADRQAVPGVQHLPGPLPQPQGAALPPHLLRAVSAPRPAPFPGRGRGGAGGVHLLPGGGGG